MSDLTDVLLLQVYADSEGEQILSCVDSGRILADFHERARLREVGICFSIEKFITIMMDAPQEARITVSVQNLVEEMVDIVETGETERREEVAHLNNYL